jgi:NTE family protein
MIKSNNFNLILSGGAALGYAHIGVLEYLEENNLTPKTLHGVSMGAIVASVMAMDISFCDKQQLFEDVFTSLKWIKLKLDGSLISTKKIETILTTIFGNKKIGELDKELSVVATNYHDGELTVFDKNSDIRVVDAVLASMAVPGLFPPREIDGKLFVDGYLSSNLPLSSINNDCQNIIVNVTGSKSFKKLSSDNLENLSIFSNLERSIRIFIYNQTKQFLSDFKKKYIMIEPDVSEFKTSYFHKFYEIKKRGYDEARAVLKL